LLKGDKICSARTKIKELLMPLIEVALDTKMVYYGKNNRKIWRLTYDNPR